MTTKIYLKLDNFPEVELTSLRDANVPGAGGLPITPDVGRPGKTLSRPGELWHLSSFIAVLDSNQAGHMVMVALAEHNRTGEPLKYAIIRMVAVSTSGSQTSIRELLHRRLAPCYVSSFRTSSQYGGPACIVTLESSEKSETVRYDYGTP